MKSAPQSTPKPITIPPEIAAKCDGPDQHAAFDRGLRAFLSVPKSAVVKAEKTAKRRKARAQSGKQ
jgi:hypothetical protein